MPRRIRDPITRLLRILALLPRAPRKIGTREIHAKLLSEGYDVSCRTIERDLHRLRAALPIVLDRAHRPFGWAWDHAALRPRPRD